ncbi:MAG: YeeE/YedE family protein [Stellaceae bacterium]
MRPTLDSTLAWWIAGPILGLVIVSFLALANKRFGVLGGVTDLVQGSAEGRGLRSWRALLLLGIVLGGLAYALLAGAPDAGSSYSWLDAHLSPGGEVALLFGAGVLIGVGARTAGGCTSGHGLTGSALASPASIVSMMTIMATAIGTTFLLGAVI